MNRRLRRGSILLGTGLMWMAAPGLAQAMPGGIFDQATPYSAGCFCHSNPAVGTPLDNPSPLTNVLVTIDGQPIQVFSGWEPGERYDVSVWVLGPTPGLAGFNLDFSGGVLEPTDDTSKTRHLTECGRMGVSIFPACKVGQPGNDCGVRLEPACPVYDRNNAACVRCDTVDESTCRACDDQTLVDVQATHADSTLPVLRGKPIPNWDFVWTAPDDPAPAAVVVHAAGNDVSGEGSSGLDFWNFMIPNPAVLPRK